MREASGRSFLLGMSRYLQAAAPPLASPVELLAAAGHPSAAVLLALTKASPADPEVRPSAAGHPSAAGLRPHASGTAE